MIAFRLRSVACSLTILSAATTAAMSLGSCDAPGASRQAAAEREGKVIVPAVEMADWVNDAADILTSEEEAALSKKLAAFEAQTQHQMMIVTVLSLEGQDIASFTTDFANFWGVGRQEHNDGIVMLVAPTERQARIAVGLGLEDLLTDKFCREVMNGEMTPRFAQGDYYGGIDAGRAKLMEALD